MEETAEMSDQKKLFIRVLVIAMVIGLIVGGGILVFRKQPLISPISQDENGDVRVIFISPKPSETSVASSSVTLKTSPKPTPKSLPKTSSSASPSASPKE